MSFMVYVAHQRGLLTADEKYRIIHCMLGLELPVWHQGCTLALVQKSLRDRLKHAAGSLRMPLPTGLGHAGIIIQYKTCPNNVFNLVNAGNISFVCGGVEINYMYMFCIFVLEYF